MVFVPGEHKASAQLWGEGRGGGYRERSKTIVSARKIGGFCWRVLGCVYHSFLAGTTLVTFTSAQKERSDAYCFLSILSP